MLCPECEGTLVAGGACYKSGVQAGYKYYCENCRVWWVDATDGTIYRPDFLTLLVQPKVNSP